MQPVLNWDLRWLIEWWELPVQVWRWSNLSFYHLFANKTAFSHTLLLCALTPMLELILSLGTKDPGSIEYQRAMDPHLLLRLQSANQNPLNRLLTNQRYGWCKTGCRGKVVYNAGPGAGGDRQELAVAVPGSGLPCSLGSVSSENMRPDGHYRTLTPVHRRRIHSLLMQRFSPFIKSRTIKTGFKNWPQWPHDVD